MNVQTAIYLPMQGARFCDGVVRFWRKYATFSGRASRSEYWWAILFLAICGTVIEVVVVAMTGLGTGGSKPLSEWESYLVPPLIGVPALILFLPNLAVTVRRLHDTNRRGAFVLTGVIPVVGLVVLFVLLLFQSDPAGVRFDRRVSS